MLHIRNGILSMRLGDSGNSVKYIQGELGIEQDSSFGPKTRSAVISFQTNNGLVADGIVGPATFLAICKCEIEIQFYRDIESLEIELVNGGESGISTIFECSAISGLPVAHTRISELIQQGRKDLNLTTNYMRATHDDVSDVGPIPDGGYELELKQGMPFQKTGGGWGVGGWYLDPGFISRGLYRAGFSRGGFFLHHDGNGVGTGGCIGVSSGGNMRTLQSILISYHETGSRDNIDVTVH